MFRKIPEFTRKTRKRKTMKDNVFFSKVTHSFFYKNNFIRTIALIFAGKKKKKEQAKKQAKNKARLAVPQNIRTKCLEQSDCGIRFSNSVKGFKKFLLKSFFMLTHTVLRCICYFSPVIFDRLY